MIQDAQVVGLVAVLCLFGGPFLGWITYLVCQAWMRVRTHERDVELKHRMLEAGFSADEIERVVAAGGQPPTQTTTQVHQEFH